MTTAPVALLFGVHAHQPVGNFPEVIEDAHLRCYRMFIEVLADYPEFRFSVHFSGWLLGELLRRYPKDMERLATMTRRGQVEWFGSGDCEPVLASIPHRDRVSQIEALSDRIERHFGIRPRGAWLTERVWESAVVPSLADTGIRYVAVDDYHFLCTGRPANQLDGYYSTEEDGRRLDLFPISEAARYRFPFAPAHEVVAWLEERARQGEKAVVYFDDIEKFGIWPETYSWVYEKGWLRRFIEGVLASPLVVTQSFDEFHGKNPTRGVVYLPTASYSEMNEWTLPASAARIYNGLLHAERDSGRLDRVKPFIRGGIWRNFFSRYPESNWMHKRMLAASERLAATRGGDRGAMRDLLHNAQANDAYWHGLFGGLYLPHLRRAVWNNLLALERSLDALRARPALEKADLDMDGAQEVFLWSRDLLAVVRADGDAALVELSSYPLTHNFGDSLRRIDEVYHDKLGHHAQAGHASGDGIASAHDRVAFRHAVSVSDAIPDSRPRGLFVDTWIPDEGAALPLDDYQPGDTEGSFVHALPGGALEKAYRVEGGILSVRYSPRLRGGRLGIVINLAMPSCDGFLGRYVLEDGKIPGGFGDPLVLPACRRLVLEDGVLGASLVIGIDGAAELSARPHMTVSQSEAGFEKIMQAVEIDLTVRGNVSLTLQVVPASPAGK